MDMIQNYIKRVVDKITYSTSAENFKNLFSLIVKNKSIQLWNITTSESEFVKYKRLLGMDKAKNILKDKDINDALLQNGLDKLVDSKEIIVIHDGSDIRKEYTKTGDNLGKVRDLNGKMINGYSSFNSVAIDIHGRNITLLGTEIYSNKADEFISQKDLKLAASPLSKKATLEEQKHYEDIKSKIESTEYINNSLVAQKKIEEISVNFKKSTPDIQIIHVADRGYDDKNFFVLIGTQLKDQFVIRLKASRCSKCDESDSKLKLIDKPFKRNAQRQYEKIMIKSKVYQDAGCTVEWGEMLHGYSVVRVTLSDRTGKKIYKQPMMLITNKYVNNEEDAFKIYQIYLKRSKIEGVFKFLKDELGWENFRIKDYDAIKTLLSLCYFVGSYFYEIESALIENESVRFISRLGGGKGKVTRIYFLRGMIKIFNKVEVDEYIKENNISEDEIIRIVNALKKGELCL